jgi:hypothetical protein
MCLLKVIGSAARDNANSEKHFIAFNSAADSLGLAKTEFLSCSHSS